MFNSQHPAQLLIPLEKKDLNNEEPFDVSLWVRKERKNPLQIMETCFVEKLQTLVQRWLWRCLGAGQGQPPFSFGAVTMGQEALLTTCLFTKELSQKAALLQVTQGIY